MIQPFSPVAEAASLHLRAVHCAEAGNLAEAAEYLEGAVNAVDCRAEWFNDLGIIHEAAGNAERALAAYTKSVSLEPNSVRAHTGCGRVLFQLGLTSEAKHHFTQALLLQPGAREASVGLAQILADETDFNEAVDVLHGSLKLDGDHPATHRLLASIYALCGEDALALTHWRKVASLTPEDGEALAGLVRACWGLGDIEGVLTHAAALIQSGRASLALHSFYLYTLLYSDATTPARVKEECLRFGERIQPASVNVFQPGRQPEPDRKLRIGYLSGEFQRGASFYFLSPLFQNHNREQFEIFCYHTRNVFDSITEWYSRVGHWRDCRGMDDAAIRRLLRDDGIDILVDSSGFFPDHRLQIFAERAAPVQIFYPNCPITTGVAEMDYILTDRWTCPPESEWQYTEQAVYLPSGYLVYSPPSATPPVAPLPLERNGFVTFGLFQRRAKIHSRVWNAIAEVLLRCPDSHLLVQNNDRTLDDPQSPTRESLYRELTTRGVSPDRVQVYGVQPQSEVMAIMSQADIALDTFPYQGQTTTCESLWMGVPVVALSGSHHVARVGSALLERVGLSELVTTRTDDYVNTALELAASPARLRAFRAGLRDRLRASSVCDGATLAREVESAYRKAWRSWCLRKDRMNI